jgi:hypothetical protein
LPDDETATILRKVWTSLPALSSLLFEYTLTQDKQKGTYCQCKQQWGISFASTALLA